MSQTKQRISPHAKESAPVASWVRTLIRDKRTQWHELATDRFAIGKTYSKAEQAAADARGESLLTGIGSHLKSFPRWPMLRGRWRETFYRRLEEFSAETLGYSVDERRELFDPVYQRVTFDFMRMARQHQPGIRVESTFQALRNVWIMNSVQRLFGRRVELSRSVFAYSMLYPCTDNVLDDTQLSVDAKQEFNDWIEARILGSHTDTRFAHLDQLFTLIEQEHPRHTTPEVFESIMAIQHAQRAAMAQRAPACSNLDVTTLSVRKGGTSVLAHGFLVNRHLTFEQADFLFSLGFCLQLLDDLQDVRQDVRSDHLTLFSRAVQNDAVIDDLILRLLAQIRGCLAQGSGLAICDGRLIVDLTWRNCVLLLLSAVAHIEEYVSPGLRSWLESFSPLSFVAIRKLDARLRAEFGGQKGLDDPTNAKPFWHLLGPSPGVPWQLPDVCDLPA